MAQAKCNIAKPPFRFKSGSITWKEICVMGRNISIGSDLEYIEPVRNLDGKEVATITRSKILHNVNK